MYVGHIIIIIIIIIWKLLSLPNLFVTVRVTGKRVNRGAGYGLEIPFDYITRNSFPRDAPVATTKGDSVIKV